MGSASPPNTHRIRRYVRRKALLIGKIKSEMAKAADGLVSDLCAELRPRIPETPDAVLIEMLMSGIGIDGTAGAACRRISDRYLDRVGLGIVGHSVEMTEARLSTVLYMAMEETFSLQLAEALGEELDLLVELRLGTGQNRLRQVDIPELDRLELADLEIFSATLSRYARLRQRRALAGAA